MSKKECKPELRNFACRRCGNCCRPSGYVRLRGLETEALARFLGMSEFDFTARYTRLADDRTGLSLVENPDGTCIFLDDAGCRVHEVKPKQCRDFPFTWTVPGIEQSCRGFAELLSRIEKTEK